MLILRTEIHAKGRVRARASCVSERSAPQTKQASGNQSAGYAGIDIIPLDCGRTWLHSTQLNSQVNKNEAPTELAGGHAAPIGDS